MDDSNERASSQSVRPQIRTAGSNNLGLWGFGAVLVIGGAWLFSALNAQRLARENPPPALPAAYGAPQISAPPAPILPQRFTERDRERDPRYLRLVPRAAAKPDTFGSQPAARVQVIAAPPARQVIAREPYVAEPVPASERRPMQVYPGPGAAASNPAPAADISAERTRAGRLANPSLTVPFGTIIPAVLETALDSTQPGYVRALIQQDIQGFDGARVLIPRGSRLYGEYEADLKPGQKRALVRWSRLLRPDGVTVALDSPASDPLGRAGIRGKVDSKFFQRFGSAILQSVLDVGVGLATRRATDGVIVALPGATTNVTGTAPADIKPTLSVKPGTSVSVYVARDLDFSDVEF